MAAVQHTLSNGKTHFYPLVAAVLIIAMLWALQLAVSAVVKIGKHLYALTFLPSMLALAAVTGCSVSGGHVSHGISWWGALLILIVWGGVVILAKKTEQYSPVDRSSGLFSRAMWINLLVMSILIIGVTALGNTNITYQYQVRIESALMKGDNEKAQTIGKRSLETNGNLLMLRMYALSRQGLLGERLFEYSIRASSQDMLPSDGKTEFEMYPADSLYRHLGARPTTNMQPMDYLAQLLRQNKATRAVADYLLCGMLIDRRIDDFARNVGKFYDVSGNLPKYYRDALTLYSHLRSNPVVLYHNNVTEEDYADFRELEKQYTDEAERAVRISEKYRYSYWYYYYYEI